MKNYTYKETTRIINKQKHTAIIPDKHSTIDALILETKDLNAWDSWANITRYHTLCLILRKGERKWETIYDGPTHSFAVNGTYLGNVGIYSVLFQLENEKTRNSYRKKAEIKELKDRIKKDTKRLQKLQGKKLPKKLIGDNAGKNMYYAHPTNEKIGYNAGNKVGN